MSNKTTVDGTDVTKHTHTHTRAHTHTHTHTHFQQHTRIDDD